MLPWENLPVLRNQEVYRMPSVSSISALLNRSCNHHEQVERSSLSVPLIDPLDAFYLLNPDGDLKNTESEFENWFRDQDLEVNSQFEFHKIIKNMMKEMLETILFTY